MPELLLGWISVVTAERCHQRLRGTADYFSSILRGTHTVTERWRKTHRFGYLKKVFLKVQLLYINCTESESQQILIALVRLLYWNMTHNEYRYSEWLEILLLFVIEKCWVRQQVIHFFFLSNNKIVLHRKCHNIETVPGTLNTHIL